MTSDDTSGPPTAPRSSGPASISLAELQEMAQLEGVELIACKMSIDMFELDPDALVEGVTIWNADEFTSYAAKCKLCLFT